VQRQRWRRRGKRFAGPAPSVRLVLFFTRGVSLQTWVASGLVDRERLLYEGHLGEGSLKDVGWITYGVRDRDVAMDLRAKGQLDERIGVHPMPKIFGTKIGTWLYSLLVPVVHRSAIGRADLIKTNQFVGGIAAIVAKLIYRKPLLARGGYIQSKLEQALGRRSWLRVTLMKWEERLTLRAADAIIVTSEHDAEYARSVLGADPARVNVIPNYLDVRAFAPSAAESIDKARRIIWVGRFSPEKNVVNLVRACADIGVGLDLVGAGPQEAELRQLVNELGADVQFLGVIPNQRLPAVLNAHPIFALPSLYEGMPKALLEAMACGLICVGTDVPGINEVLKDGVNGYLANGIGAAPIAVALRRALNAEGASIAAAARRLALETYSLAACARKEQVLLAKLTERGPSV
jgi:glycosyltransferase involved in cell wall biosynthesis